tara:strand:+ start:89 stop:325 length:237 start_codon:yes stop_codon:yes gene_type:complete
MNLVSNFSYIQDIKKLFLGWSIKSWLIFILVMALAGALLEMLTDLTTIQISITCMVLSFPYMYIERKLFKKSKPPKVN